MGIKFAIALFCLVIVLAFSIIGFLIYDLFKKPNVLKSNDIFTDETINWPKEYERQLNDLLNKYHKHEKTL
jgi:hypothetical protein